MKMFGYVMVLCLMLSAVGCNYKYSYNMQRASARSAGDLGMTAVMDAVDPTSQGQIEEYTAFIYEIIALLDSGAIGEMTKAEFQRQLNFIVPVKYSSYTASLMAFAGGINVPVDSVLPERVIVLLKDFCNGSITALKQYTMGKNVPEVKGDTATTSKTVTAWGREITTETTTTSVTVTEVSTADYNKSYDDVIETRVVYLIPEKDSEVK
jgi:hypothetical protein